MTTVGTYLRIDASARRQGSDSRRLGDLLIEALTTRGEIAKGSTRDVSDGLPFVTEDWVEANFTPDDVRTATHKETLSLSDSLVDELKSADVLIITTPTYNFGIPSTLKAWIDLIARARLTFKYTENGPVGLLDGKKAYVVMTSGGTPFGAPADFVSPYLKHVLGFVGLEDVEFIAADSRNRGDVSLEAAQDRIAAMANG